LAVVFAILSSYVLSRTLVPVLVKYLLRGEAHLPNENRAERIGIFKRVYLGFNSGFEAMRRRYVEALRWSLGNRATVFVVFAVVVGGTFVTLPWVGRDFFPTVDAGQFRLHVRAPTGTRLERTEQIFSDVEREIRRTIPRDEVALVMDNIGVISNKFSLAFGDNATIGSADGEILVALNKERKHSTQIYMAAVRDALHKRFPNLTFFYQPADIVSQILNFGLPAPINIKIAGSARPENYALALKLRDRIAHIPGAVDVRILPTSVRSERQIRRLPRSGAQTIKSARAFGRVAGRRESPPWHIPYCRWRAEKKRYIRAIGGSHGLRTRRIVVAVGRTAPHHHPVGAVLASLILASAMPQAAH